MESLNSYISDGESDTSPYNPVSKKSYSGSDEVDANCEPITMDMSEDSRSGQSDDNDGKFRKNESKRHYSKSLSPSPPTSVSSRDSSPRSKKNASEIRSSSERSKWDSTTKDRRRDDEKRRDDRHYKRHDDRSRRSRDEREDRDKDRHRGRDSDRHSKRYESRRSNRSRSRSSSHSKHRSSKRKQRSRSRSRSYDRHHRKRSPRQDRHPRRSPYRSRRSRSKSKSKEKSKSYDWKSTSKLKVLEKLGIELKLPPVSMDVSQTSIISTMPNNSVSNNSNNNSHANVPLTPQLLLQKSMEEQVEKVKTATGIQLPSYYNPMAVNPTKYAEQIQKRRLLWGNKTKEPQPKINEVAPVPENKSGGTIWKGATFGGDQDGKMTAKFQRLMGMKGAEQAPPSTSNETKVEGSDLIKKQEEMFHSMESQYEVARLATHSHRGLGLGFGTFQPR